MSQEIIVPFALNPSGGIAATSDPAVMTQQHVDSLVSTRPGERVMVPAYGVDVLSMLFGQSTAVAKQSLTADVQQAMATYEPGVRVLAVTPVSDQSATINGMASVNVDYVTTGPNGNSAPATTTATVLPGGTVIETAR